MQSCLLCIFCLWALVFISKLTVHIKVFDRSKYVSYFAFCYHCSSCCCCYLLLLLLLLHAHLFLFTNNILLLLYVVLSLSLSTLLLPFLPPHYSFFCCRLPSSFGHYLKSFVCTLDLLEMRKKKYHNCQHSFSPHCFPKSSC